MGFGFHPCTKHFLSKMLCLLISFTFTMKLNLLSTCTQVSIEGTFLRFFCSAHMQDQHLQHLPTVTSCQRSTKTFYFRSPISRCIMPILICLSMVQKQMLYLNHNWLMHLCHCTRGYMLVSHKRKDDQSYMFVLNEALRTYMPQRGHGAR
jgi:hypothetical protein